MVLFSHSKEIQEIFLQLGRYKDKIFNFFNPKRLKRTSTTSQLHLYIHEFAHSIQPKAIIEQKVELPSKYTHKKLINKLRAFRRINKNNLTSP